MNFLTYYKITNPNLYSLLISMLLAVWYNGISGLLNYYFPNRGPGMSLVLLIIPLTVFLLDDGDLGELYSIPKVNYPASTKTAAVTTAAAAQAQAQQQQQSQQASQRQYTK